MYPYSESITSFLYLLFFTLTIIKAQPITYACGSVASDGPYKDSVTNIMVGLYLNAPGEGFSTVKLGDAAGYALCRRDVDFNDCSACIYRAADNILNLCLQSQRAFIYYDYCYITYLPLQQAKKYVYDSNIYYCSHSSIHINDPGLLDSILSSLFTNIAMSAQQESRFFGAGYTPLGDTHTLYGYAQCFNDMLGQDCQACINELTNQLPNTCTQGFVGGRLLGGTCILRFEIYNFLNINFLNS